VYPSFKPFRKSVKNEIKYELAFSQKMEVAKINESFGLDKAKKNEISLFSERRRYKLNVIKKD
jgi:hypothetical protein